MWLIFVILHFNASILISELCIMKYSLCILKSTSSFFLYVSFLFGAPSYLNRWKLPNELWIHIPILPCTFYSTWNPKSTSLPQPEPYMGYSFIMLWKELTGIFNPILLLISRLSITRIRMIKFIWPAVIFIKAICLNTNNGTMMLPFCT